MRYQIGVGLVEIMVALVLLSISILGFGALQIRAIDTSSEAANQVTALGLARDLAERMRANPQAVRQGHYLAKNGIHNKNLTNDLLFNQSQLIAQQDLQAISQQAEQYFMKVLIDMCPQTGGTRQCIYIAWDKTAQNSFDSAQKCYTNGRYVFGSKCLFLEAY